MPNQQTIPKATQQKRSAAPRQQADNELDDSLAESDTQSEFNAEKCASDRNLQADSKASSSNN
jgi:hypothetical protein